MNPTILLVEDNASDEKLTLRALKGCGVLNDVVVARDGAAALDYLLGPAPAAPAPPAPALPTLVLLDLNLPKVGGLDVLARLRAHERTKLLPVVVLTTSGEEEDVLRSYTLGANAYVRKPVDFAQFADAVKTLGLFWLLLNEPPPKPKDPG
ncbi:MAG TPA: response regulator [Byssovorax sp.]|jgi:CheY-like chemotaxis protein